MIKIESILLITTFFSSVETGLRQVKVHILCIKIKGQNFASQVLSNTHFPNLKKKGNDFLTIVALLNNHHLALSV